MTSLCPCDRCQYPETVDWEAERRAWLERINARNGGPALPEVYAEDNDVNPICGHHKSANCVGCGTCTSCDACYCGEE